MTNSATTERPKASRAAAPRASTTDDDPHEWGKLLATILTEIRHCVCAVSEHELDANSAPDTLLSITISKMRQIHEAKVDAIARMHMLEVEALLIAARKFDLSLNADAMLDQAQLHIDTSWPAIGGSFGIEALSEQRRQQLADRGPAAATKKPAVDADPGHLDVPATEHRAIADKLILWGTYEVEALTDHMIDFLDTCHTQGDMENGPCMVLRAALIRIHDINAGTMSVMGGDDHFTLFDLSEKVHQYARLRQMREEEVGAA